MIRYLVAQSANPEGPIGRILTRIWSGHFAGQARWAFSLVNLQSFRTILDVGFGGGSGVRHIADQNTAATIHGIDISAESLKTARRRNVSHIKAGRVHLSLADVTTLPFAGDTFDLIYTCQSHIYWADLRLGLCECRRVLEEGGTLLLTSEEDKIHYHLPAYERHSDFADLLRELGFHNVEIVIQNGLVAFLATK